MVSAMYGADASPSLLTRLAKHREGSSPQWFGDVQPMLRPYNLPTIRPAMKARLPSLRRDQRKAHDAILCQLRLDRAVGELGVERADQQPVGVDALLAEEGGDAGGAALGKAADILGGVVPLGAGPGRVALDL